MPPKRTTLAYLVIGILWILISDRLSVGGGYVANAAKGVAFVLATGALLYALMNRFHNEIERRRRLAEENSMHFQSLVENAPIGIFVQSDSRFQYLNPAAVRMFNVQDKADLLGSHVIERFDPAFHGLIGQRMRQVNEEQLAVPPVHLVIPLPNGQYRDMQSSAVPIPYKGKPAALVYMVDITERRSRERLFLQLAELLPAIVYIANPEGGVTYLNDKWFDYTGEQRERVTPEDTSYMIHPADVPRVSHSWQAALAAKSPFQERLRLRDRDGTYRWFLSRAVPMVLSDGEVVNWFGLSMDVDEPSRVIDRMDSAIEAERLRISRELHDDLGQILVAAKLHTELALRFSEDREKRIAQIRDTLITGIQRTRNMSAMLRPPDLEHSGLLAALRTHAAQWQSSSDVECTLRAGTKMPRLPYNTSLALYRIVQEALTNIAKHASATKVAIAVESAADLLRITVTDNGSGFDPGTLERAAGLGLLNMKERAIAAGAILNIRTGPQGTSVSVELPLSGPSDSGAA